MAKSAPNSWLVLAGGSALAAGLSCLVRPGLDLWESLAAGHGLLGAGSLGVALWQGVFSVAGIWGIGAVRAVAVLALSLWALKTRSDASPKETETEAETEKASLWLFLPLLATWAVLLPWGSGLLFYAFLGASLAFARSRLWVAFLLCLLWPSFDILFPVGVFLVFLAALPFSKKAWWLLAAPLLNPAGSLAFWTGDVLTPWAASWVGHPGYAAPMPDSPAFYLAALWGISAVASSFAGGRRLAAGCLAAAFGMALRPLGALPSFFSGSKTGGSTSLLPLALLTLPFSLWLLVSPRQEPPPGQALALLQSLPRGAWTLQTDPAWSAPLALDLGRGRVAPTFTAREFFNLRERYPKGLAPPFEGAPIPAADLLLLKPSYPAMPFSQELAKGWSLVGAGSRYALFVRDTPVLSEWVMRNRLEYYSPFCPPPGGPIERRRALDEARRLLDEDPGFFEALRDAGRMETDFQMASDAAEHLRRALKLAPKNALVWNDLGVALQIGGDTQGATEAYVRSVGLDGSELLPRFNLASLLLQMGKPGEAEALLKSVIAARPLATIAYRRLAQVLVSEGKRAEAKEVLDRIPPDMRLPEDQEILKGTAQ